LTSILSEVENLVDHVLTGGTAHDNLCVSTVGQVGVCVGFVHLVFVLSLCVNSRQVLLLSRAFLLQGLVLGLNVGELGLLFNRHNPRLLVSINNECLRLSLRLVNLLNGLGLDLLHDDVTVTLSINDLLVSLSLRI
jgi:hypothetical protein